MGAQSKANTPAHQSCNHPKSVPVYARRKARGAGQTIVLGRLCTDCHAITGGPDGVEWRPNHWGDNTTAEKCAEITMLIRDDGYELRSVEFGDRGGRVRAKCLLVKPKTLTLG
jgi:hypothetical protein